MDFKRKEIWSTTIPMQPEAKQSVQFNRKTGKAFQPKDKERYVNTIAKIVQQDKPEELVEGPVELEVIFAYPMLKSAKKKDKERGWMFKATAPDDDNLVKPVRDALQGVLMKSDGQIARSVLTKIHSKSAFIRLKLSKLEEND